MTPRDVNWSLAKGYLKLNRIDDALLELHEMEERGDACEQSRQMIAGILLNRKAWFELHAFGCNVLANTKSRSPTGWIAVIYALVGDGLLDEALEKARVAVIYCRTCAALWLELGRILVYKKDYVEADEALSIAYDINANTLVIMEKDPDFIAYFVWYRDVKRKLRE